MSIEDGKIIAIKFTENLSGDVTGLTPAPRGYTTLTMREAGSVTGSSEYSSSYPVANIADDSTSSYWRPSTTSNEWLEIRLRLPTPLTALSFYTNSSYSPKDYTVEASKDGISYAEIATGSFTQTTGWQELPLTGDTYQYYRINILNIYSSQLRMYEVQVVKPIGNEAAFSITGKVYDMVPEGELIDKEVEVYSVRYKAQSEDDIYVELDSGTFTNTLFEKGKVTLAKEEVLPE